MHAALVANIINAVGGKPSFSPTPNYPTHLPGGVQPDLVVPIEKVSIALIRNIFMKIEQPEWELQEKFVHVWKYIDSAKPRYCRKNEDLPSCEDEKADMRYSDQKANDYLCHHPSDREQITLYGLRGTVVAPFFVFQP